jgi:hypothetical protein
VTAMDTETLIAVCANDVYRRFSSYVDRDDLVSEAHLWILAHPTRMAHLEEDSIENPARATYRLRREITMSMEIFARGEKASRAGYSPNDEFFYDKTLVEMLLPYVLAGDPEPPQVPDDDAPRSIHDPAEGNNWAAMYVDVKTAWESIEKDDRDLYVLALRLEREHTFETIGEMLGTSTTEARRTYQGVLRRVVRALGGLRPDDCPNTCECHDGPLRRRPGVRSNLSGVDQLMG